MRASPSAARRCVTRCAGSGLATDEADAILAAAGVTPNVRAESLSLETFAALAERIPA